MRKGFTLIELLVVIAIIAILAMLLFPVFVGVLNRARTQKCLTHGRELGIAMSLYIDDYNGRCPSTLGDEERKRFIGKLWWQGYWDTFYAQDWSLRYGRLDKYVKSEFIWICPNLIGDVGRRYAYGYKQNWIPRVRDPYFGDDPGLTNSAHPDPNTGCAPGKTLGEIEGERDKNGNRVGKPPTKKIAWWCVGWGEGVSVSGWQPNTLPYFPHDGGSIYVYLDGHAKWAKMGRLWAPPGYLPGENRTVY
jgi:prepilin-type N-terminal cleavage/methylation domain-containing protein/prepilin-type processing-associated H-X9-DG protein